MAVEVNPPGLVRRFWRERGAAAVEFAIVLPLLVLVIFGTVEFGAAWSQKTDVNHGAREAARLAAVN
ncbi:MAG: pilus assembly protein, partial [Acidimicrobiia bacterium]|nr:pilus assembly protein [Acidimicrobiia bacterium]